jgi:hypothetical protein
LRSWIEWAAEVASMTRAECIVDDDLAAELASRAMALANT